MFERDQHCSLIALRCDTSCYAGAYHLYCQEHVEFVSCAHVHDPSRVFFLWPLLQHDTTNTDIGEELSTHLRLVALLRHWQSKILNCLPLEFILSTKILPSQPISCFNLTAVCNWGLLQARLFEDIPRHVPDYVKLVMCEWATHSHVPGGIHWLTALLQLLFPIVLHNVEFIILHAIHVKQTKSVHLKLDTCHVYINHIQILVIQWCRELNSWYGNAAF